MVTHGNPYGIPAGGFVTVEQARSSYPVPLALCPVPYLTYHTACRLDSLEKHTMDDEGDVTFGFVPGAPGSWPPRMLSVCRGTVRTDAEGHATVELPTGFTDLHYRIRSRVIGVRPPVHAARVQSLDDDRLVLRSTGPDVTVRWEVTGMPVDF